MTLFSITLVLFLIMDPLGNISSFLNMLKDESPTRQRLIIFREMSIALAAMVLFNFIGDYIFDFLKVSEVTVRLSSGVILFLIAVQIIYPSVNSLRENLPEVKPFIIPLAIPLIAGPSLLATIMLYAHLQPSNLLMLYAIFLAWIAATIVMLLSKELFRILGNNGLVACEKLMGMILVLLAIQRFMDGVQMFIQSVQ
ncbi:MAG: antibiotic transporter [Chlamydiales bacterium]|nr:antibiotic transporter [Chlamydiia bacterium]MCP5508656.1 antibiotic transporter [Chlamydiales bacterium]